MCSSRYAQVPISDKFKFVSRIHWWGFWNFSVFFVWHAWYTHMHVNMRTMIFTFPCVSLPFRWKLQRGSTQSLLNFCHSYRKRSVSSFKESYEPIQTNHVSYYVWIIRMNDFNLPFCLTSFQHQQQVVTAVERAKQVSMSELNTIIGVSKTNILFLTWLPTYVRSCMHLCVIRCRGNRIIHFKVVMREYKIKCKSNNCSFVFGSCLILLG